MPAPVGVNADPFINANTHKDVDAFLAFTIPDFVLAATNKLHSLVYN